MSELIKQSLGNESTNNSNRIEDLRLIADYLRRDAFEVIRSAQNGHIGGSSSSVELLTALYFGGQFNFDPDNPQNPNRDLVLIRGHEGPIRYPIFSLLGYIERDELWTYRSFESRLQGHEDMHETPGVDITPSGSLGMLLSYGVGAAIVSKEQGLTSRSIVFLGDGEEQEGNVGEAARHASSLDLDNLICIIDKNKKQLSRPTKYSDPNSNLSAIWGGYGWDVIEISDGHDLKEIMTVYDGLRHIAKPTVIIANTIKGNGIEGSEDHFSGYHTLSTISDSSLLDSAIDRITNNLGPDVSDSYIGQIALSLVSRPAASTKKREKEVDAFDIRFNGSGCINMEQGQSMYFSELSRRIQDRPETAPFYMITPDLLRTDIVDELGIDKFVTRYLDTGLREQHSIAMAHGISVRDPDARVYLCYGDAFVFRAADQMNAAATGGSNMLVVGENSGLFQGQNGKTHQSVSQPGALLQIPEATVLEPADVHDLYNIFSDNLTQNKGFTYVRLHRGDMDILDRDPSDMRNTDAYFVHRSDKIARLVIAASGFMVNDAVLAARHLETEHEIPVSVINVVNQKTLGDSLPQLLENDAPVLTLYNGNPITLQANVSGAILGNSEIPRPKFVIGHGFVFGTSGKVKELIHHYKLDKIGIEEVALKSLSKYGLS
jgi:transketolase